ncbi:MAG: sigma-70 family RNA polymerase sigma factor [Clostridia bacterium]|nr:sigma-70 family RNA polymerase sigma factor [Clostridia bacterium]
MTKILSEVKKYPLLTRERERELAVMIHSASPADSQAAFDELVNCNLKLVMKIAGNYHGRGCDMEDLVSVGSIGLMKAASKYRPDRGAKFSTYAAIWIKTLIRKYIVRYRGIVTHPVNSALGKYKMMTADQKALNDEGEVASDKEVARLTHHQVDTTRAWRRPTRYVFLNADDSAMGRLPQVKDDEEEKADMPDMEFIRSVMEGGRLTSFQRMIVTYRFGLNGNPPMSLEQIAKFVGRSRERVRQVEQQALDVFKKEWNDGERE